MNARAEELFKDEEFLKKILGISAEDAQKEFLKKGAEITVDELNDIAAQINATISSGEELDETALDHVAGGAWSRWQTVKFAAGVAVGIAVVCTPW